jgi:hypothetical protein
MNGERLPPLNDMELDKNYHSGIESVVEVVNHEATVDVMIEGKATTTSTGKKGLGEIATIPQLHTEFYLTGPDAEVLYCLKKIIFRP